MVALVVDASAALAAFFRDERSEPALRVIERMAEVEAAAPMFFPFELANGFTAAVRRGRATVEEAEQSLRRIESFEVKLIEIDMTAVITAVMPLARRLTLSAYDASYLYLAKILRVPLATLDGRLRSAAIAEQVPMSI